MSSAANHQKRSHRSYSNKRSAMGKISSGAKYRSRYFENPFIGHSILGSLGLLLSMAMRRVSKRSTTKPT